MRQPDMRARGSEASAGMSQVAAAPMRASMSLALGSGTILQGLNSALIAVALVPIALHFGEVDSIPWLVASLYLAAAVAAPTAGKLGDVFGPRRIYIAGLVIVLIASVASPFLPSVGWLIVGRVVLGIGTSFQFPNAMAVIRRVAKRTGSDPRRALGIVAVCGQTSAALGPVVGGVVVQFFDWPGIFWVNVPVVANSLIWVLLAVPRDHPPELGGTRRALRKLDPLGMMLFSAVVVCLMFFLVSLKNVPAPVWALAAVVLGVGFVLFEQRSRFPFIDLRLLAANPTLWRTCLRAVVTFTAFYTVFYGIPQWLEAGPEVDAGVVGLLMLPIFGVGAVSTYLASRLARFLSPRSMLSIGSGAMVLAGAAIVVLLSGNPPLWLIAAICGLLGVPNGFNNLGNQYILHAAAPPEFAGTASGIYRTSQFIGAALSSAIVAQSLPVPAVASGNQPLGFWVLGLAGALLLDNLFALILVRARRMRKAAK